MNDKSILTLIAFFLAIGIGAWSFSEPVRTQVAAPGSTQSTSMRRPGLKILGESLVDLGKFNAGEPIGYHFELRNILDRDVMILAANPSCGCMKIPDSLLRKPIPPGEIVEIPVIMNTEGRSGVVSGRVQIICGHKPDVGTKITETSEISIQMKCEIENRIRVTPDKINFGNIASRESAIVPFSVERMDGGKLSDVIVNVPGAHFRLEEYRLISENGKEIGKGKIVPAEVVFGANGNYGGTIELNCPDIGGKETTQVIEITAISEPNLTTVPRNLVLFARRKPTAELTLIGSAVDSILEIACSRELESLLTFERRGSKLLVTYDHNQKGGEIDNSTSYVKGEIIISYHCVLSNSQTPERCSVRVVIVP